MADSRDLQSQMTRRPSTPVVQNLLMLSPLTVGEDLGDGILVGAHDVRVSTASLGTTVKTLKLGHGTALGQYKEQNENGSIMVKAILGHF